MKIGIDLRCLNYAKYTGINSYCLQILSCISHIKEKLPNEIKIIGIGLIPSRLQELKNEFILFHNLFESFRTLGEYQNTHIKNNKLHEIITHSQIYLWNSLNCNSIEKLDYFIQPQPRLIKLHPKTKLVVFYHDFFYLHNKIVSVNSFANNSKSFELIHKRCDKIVVNSRSTALDFCRLSNTKKGDVHLVYPGIPDLNSLRTVTSTKTVDLSSISKPFVLALSGIEPRKNWHNLILAFKHLQIKYSYEKKLVLSGTIVDESYYNHLLKLIKTHRIKNIEWEIEPSETNKNSLISNCDLLVYPSFYEGFGFPLIESERHNKPVLTSKNSSLVEISSGCFFVNPNNYISIAKGILLSESTTKNYSKNKFDWLELEQFLEFLFQ